MLSVNSSIDNAMSNAPHMITWKIFQLVRPPCQHRLTQCEMLIARAGGQLDDFPCNHMRALLMALSMEEFTDNTVPPGHTSGGG